MSDSTNVLCVGNATEDEVVHFNGELHEEQSVRSKSKLSVGGGATNTALVLGSTQYVDTVYLAAPVGMDDRGHRVLTKLKNNNVDLVLERGDDESTPLIRAFIFEDEKPQYAHEDVGFEPFSPEDVSEDVWEDIDHVHMTSFSKDITTEFASYASERDITISFNPTQGYADTEFGDVVQNASLVQMNRSESETFRERNGPLGTVVDELDTDVVITHGPAGCTMYSRDGVASHSGYPNAVGEVVDTVGAGDSFMAGLISSWLAGKNMEYCLRYANAHGALSVTNMGSPNTISRDSVSEIMDMG